LRKRFSTEVYCGHFGTGLGGGPNLSAETLGTLAELGLSLRIRTYWRSAEPD
jgi:hypothetical protein